MAESLRIKFPCQEVLIDQAALTSNIFDDIERRMAVGDCPDGFVHVERKSFADLLLLYQRGMHSAVRFHSDRFEPLPVTEFFGAFKDPFVQRFRLCRTDVGLVLLMAVVLQNKPARSATGAQVEAVLAEVAAAGGTAALLLTNGVERHVVYCREGKPVVFYVAGGDATPPAHNARQRLVDYCRAHPTCGLHTYRDLQSRRDEHATRPMSQLLGGQLGATPFFITVKRGGETIERRLLQDGKATLGRDPGNTVVLEDRSVSRHHCLIQWENGRHVVRDCGSSNGTLVNGERREESTLKAGDVIKLGEFMVHFALEEPSDTHEELQTMFMDATSGVHAGGNVTAQLVFGGEVVTLDRPVFTLGKADDAGLKLGGFRMRPVQATIVQEPGGNYRLLRVDGGLSVKLNGGEVPKGGVLLKSGNQIAVGKHQIVFMLAAHQK